MIVFQPALITEVDPLLIDAELPVAEIDLDAPTARVELPARAEVRVDRDGEDFLVSGWLTATLLLQCGRCAVWFPQPVRVKVEHLLEGPHPSSIDLTPLLREDILLELPLNAACRLGADGRCPVTGEVYRSRPETPGSLAGEAVWEALDKIKPKD